MNNFNMNNFKYIPIIAALLCGVAQAGEAQLACNLERSAAETKAAILEAPAAFGSVGDSSTSEKNITIGVMQSLSGRKQASLIRQSADAKCDAISASLQLDEYAQWSLVQVQRSAAKEQLLVIEQAVIMADANINLLAAQLAAQTITLTDHTEAVNALVEIKKKQSELIRVLAIATVTPAQTHVAPLLETLRVRESQSAEMAAQAQSETGWDTIVSVGARQPINGNKSAQPFATIGVKWSFGYSASQEAARDVGVQTAELAKIQQNGYVQTVIRQRETLKQLIGAEELELNNTRQHIKYLKQIESSVVGIDSVLSMNILRSVKLQLLVAQSEKEGILTRLDGYKNLLLALV
jgi:hypothetical protein